MSLIQKKYNKVIELSEDLQQFTLPDSRYYKKENLYYPSVTDILQYLPKGKHFENWLKQVGYFAEDIVKRASDDGSLVHEMIEQYLNGEQLDFISSSGHVLYRPDIWEMFLKFVEFWETYNPTLIEKEVLLYSDDLKTAGTCDIVCEIHGKKWIIDNKTSNSLHLSNEIQVHIYKKCFEENYNIKIDHCGLLWLKSSKRKFDKDKMQGKGWEISVPSLPHEEYLDLFKFAYKLYKIENPKEQPSFAQYKTSVKRTM